MIYIKSFKEIYWTNQPEYPITPIDSKNPNEALFKTDNDISTEFRAKIKGQTQVMVCRIEVNAGHICNGRSSLFRLRVWPLQDVWVGRPQDGMCRNAWVTHDPLYETRGNMKHGYKGVRFYCNGTPAKLSRKACDQLYKAIYKIEAPEEKRISKKDYAWLRIWGWVKWGKSKSVDNKKGRFLSPL